MKKLKTFIVLSILTTSVMAASDRHVAVCALGVGMLGNDTKRASAIFATADNQQNAKRVMAEYLNSIETSPNGNFSEIGAKRFIMDHSKACKAISVKDAFQ